MSKFFSVAAVLALAACHHDSDNSPTTTTASATPMRHSPTPLNPAATPTERGKTEVGISGQIPEETPSTLAAGSGSTTSSASSSDTVMVDPGATSTEPADSAVVVLTPTKGSKVRGTIMFHQMSDGVDVTADLQGLPRGVHAFHVHQFGDCSAPDATSAGDHFNFVGSSTKPEEKMITGDLGEVTAKSDGTATLTKKIPDATLQGKFSIIGRSVVVHAKGDDESKPPDGNAGKRLACGVIGVAQMGGALGTAKPDNGAKTTTTPSSSTGAGAGSGSGSSSAGGY